MKHIAIGCLAGTLLLILALGGAAWYWLVRDVPLLDARLEVPSEATLNSPIELVVFVSNNLERTVTMDSIEIDDSLMDAFQILSITPAAKNTISIPSVERRGWKFDQPIRNRGVETFVFELKPIMAGHFSGDVDVCNPRQDFYTLVADVVITEETDAEASETPELVDE